MALIAPISVLFILLGILALIIIRLPRNSPPVSARSDHPTAAETRVTASTTTETHVTALKEQ